MPTTWDDRLDKLLLLHMYREAGSPSLKIDQWDRVARALGSDITGSAVMQRFRKQINKLGAASTSQDSSATEKTNKRKSSDAPSHFNNDDDDGETKNTTPKRRKKQAPTSNKSPTKPSEPDSEANDLKDMFKIKSETMEDDFN